VLDLPGVIARLTIGPAGILGVDLGHLSPGAIADVCIFDTDACWIPTPGTLLSHGENSPFLYAPMHGRVIATVLEGRIVFDRDVSVSG
jgi:dihydroorotase